MPIKKLDHFLGTFRKPGPPKLPVEFMDYCPLFSTGFLRLVFCYGFWDGAALFRYALNVGVLPLLIYDGAGGACESIVPSYGYFLGDLIPFLLLI